MSGIAAIPAVIALLLWLDSYFGRQSWDLTPRIKLVKNSWRRKTGRLFIVLVGAYASAEIQFKDMDALRIRGDIMYVENPSQGYDARLTAREIMAHPELQRYEEIAIVTLSMGAKAAFELMELFAKTQRFEPENVVYLPAATSMRASDLKDPFAHIAAWLWWIGPFADALFTPVVRKVLFGSPATREWGPGAHKSRIDEFVAEMQRFRASAVFAHAKAARDRKQPSANLAEWFKRVRVVTLSTYGDQVVDFESAKNVIYQVFPRCANVQVGSGHVPLITRPREWNEGYAEACLKANIPLVQPI